MNKLKLYLMTYGAILAFPFVHAWLYIYENMSMHTIKQFLWTIMLGLMSSTSLCIAIAFVCHGAIILTLMAYWCAICFYTLAMYDYEYAIWRYL